MRAMDHIEIQGDLPLALWLDCIQGDTDKEAKALDRFTTKCAEAIWKAEIKNPNKGTGIERRKAIRRYLGYAFRRGQNYAIRKAARK